jgi:hypothetical protein
MTSPEGLFLSYQRWEEAAMDRLERGSEIVSGRGKAVIPSYLRSTHVAAPAYRTRAAPYRRLAAARAAK